MVYAGPVEEGQAVLRPLLEFGPPGVAMVQPMPYVALQRMLDLASPKGMQNYWSADFLAELPDEAVDALVEHATKPVSQLTQIILVRGGGAVARVDDEATAFGQRDAPWNMHFLSIWPDPAETWVRAAPDESAFTRTPPGTRRGTPTRPAVSGQPLSRTLRRSSRRWSSTRSSNTRLPFRTYVSPNSGLARVWQCCRHGRMDDAQR